LKLLLCFRHSNQDYLIYELKMQTIAIDQVRLCGAETLWENLTKLRDHAEVCGNKNGSDAQGFADQSETLALNRQKVLKIDLKLLKLHRQNIEPRTAG
jgi:hypothetical protein